MPRQRTRARTHQYADIDLAFNIHEPRNPLTGEWIHLPGLLQAYQRGKETKPADIDHVLGKTTTDRDYVVHRGGYYKDMFGDHIPGSTAFTHDDLSVLKGETITTSGPLSTSTDVRVAENYASSEHKRQAILHIKVPAGVHGATLWKADWLNKPAATKFDTEENFDLENEKELLLRGGLSYKVTGMSRDDDGLQHVYGEVVRPKKKPDADLARPLEQLSAWDIVTKKSILTQHKHIVRAKPDTDATVRRVARVLMSSSRFERLHGDFGQEVAKITDALRTYGVKPQAVRMALGLSHFEGGSRKGTAHVPNARLAEYGATLTGKVKEYRDGEVYFRAAYLANAAHRMQTAMDNGATQQEAIRREAPYYKAHEHARKGRLDSAAQVQTTARTVGQPDDRGTLVGWYLNPLLRNEVECIVANGHNFYAEEGTMIGFPGSVHNNCGCYAGPPIEGASLVNDAVRGLVKFQRSRPKFKLKKGRVA